MECVCVTVIGVKVHLSGVCMDTHTFWVQLYFFNNCIIVPIVWMIILINTTSHDHMKTVEQKNSKVFPHTFVLLKHVAFEQKHFNTLQPWRKVLISSTEWRGFAVIIVLPG